MGLDLFKVQTSGLGQKLVVSQWLEHKATDKKPQTIEDLLTQERKTAKSIEEALPDQYKEYCYNVPFLNN